MEIMADSKHRHQQQQQQQHGEIAVLSYISASQNMRCKVLLNSSRSEARVMV
jgi:hypothetical protein